MAKPRQSRAARSAAQNAKSNKQQPAKPATGKPATAKPKPAPAKPAKDAITPQQENRIALTALIHAAGDLLDHWDAAVTGISKAAARDRISARLAYCPPSCGWDPRLGPRKILASRQGKSTS